MGHGSTPVPRASGRRARVDADRPTRRPRCTSPAAIALALLIALAPPPAAAEDCGKALNALVRRNLQAALDRTNLCGEVGAQVGGIAPGVVKTARAQVTAFELCLSREAIDFTGRLEVTCKASEKSPVRGAISERFDIAGRVRTSDCGVSSLRVEPAGELGRLAAALYGLDTRARSALDSSLRTLCQ